MGFLVRVFVLSLLVGENLWVILTRAGAGLLEKGIDIFNLSFTPDMRQVQIVALCLIITQEIIYVLCLHALAYWIFPRLCLLYTSPSPRDRTRSRMPSSA